MSYYIYFCPNFGYLLASHVVQVGVIFQDCAENHLNIRKQQMASKILENLKQHDLCSVFYVKMFYVFEIILLEHYYTNVSF